MNIDSLLAKVVIFSVPGLWALTIHEFAHAYVAVWAGDPTPEANGRLTLNPLAHLDVLGTLCILFVGFGWAKPVPVNPLNFRNLRRDNVLVSIAGVTTNLAMAVVSAVVYRLLFTSGWVPMPSSPVLGVAALVQTWVFYSVVLNLTLAVFNMMPIPPLDGSHVVESFLPYEYRHQWASFARMGPILLIALVFTGVIGRLIGVVVFPIAAVLLGM